MNDLEAQKPWGIELNTFCMLMHLSQLSSGLVPGLGLVLPILMWALNKDEFPEIDEHGKVICNWIISSAIYSIISAILVFVVIGIFGLIAIVLCGLVFAIIGAVKANGGEVFNYPFCIKFFK